MSIQRSGSVGVSMEEEQEEDDESSNPIENELESFRQEWRSEVNKKIRVPKASPDENTSLISKAKELFQRGVDCEGNGDLYDAVQFYKKAFQLVPDIERVTFDGGGVKETHPQRNGEESSIGELEEGLANSLRITSAKITVVSGGTICEKEFSQEGTHLSALPQELLILILKWVVSSELDVSSLERASSVCKGFYGASRSPVLWKSICARTWGQEQICASGKNWRDVYLRKPRVLTHGSYISKTTYMREGEQGFQDEAYRAWHVVHYYRYVRFFPSGIVVMAVTSDPPASVLNALKTCYWPPPIQGMLYGRYRIMKNKVACILVRKSEHKVNNRKKKSKKRDTSMAYVAPEQEMQIEFTIKSQKNRSLEWSRYFIVSKYANGSEKANELDISNLNQYPDLKFSPVTSYHGPSFAPV